MQQILKKNLKKAANLVDLQLYWVHKILRQVAPSAQGKLLDVGCGKKPYQSFFTPYVDSYVGIEHEAVFQESTASLDEIKPDYYYDGKTLPFDDNSFDTFTQVCL
jgi:hypothetical protein